MRTGYILIAVLFFSFHSITGKAQNIAQEESARLFQEGKYSEAMPIFKRLITLFPKDPKYQYYAGVCMVQSNRDLNSAIEYLKFAAERSVPRDAYFFLGKAYHYLYKFDDALDAYLKFQQFGDRSQKEKWQCDMNIAMARNGKRIFEKQISFDVYQIDSVSKTKIFEYYNKFLKNGNFKERQQKSLPFFETKENTWSYIPSMLTVGQEVFETNVYGMRNSKDLVIVYRLEGDKWSDGDNPGNSINTPYDEDYAFFNTNEPALYFASKGHNSMGGYDIFKSVYNPDTKKWSSPQNLGYPINSPYDDFLYVPDDDLSKACFASNRETHGDSVKIYTISFSKEYAVTDVSANVTPITRFRIKESPVEKEKEKKIEPQKTIEKPKVQVANVEKNGSESYPNELAGDKDYNQLLELALRYQIKADSASRVAEEIRQKISSETDEARIEKMKKDIYLLEQQSKATQVKADELYEKARKFEVMYTKKKQEEEQTTEVTDETAQKTFTAKKQENTPVKENKKIIYDFRIMAKTPYKTLADIPLDKPSPDGLLYRIQMGAFSMSIEPERFKGIVPICAETVQNTPLIKYYAGMFSRMVDAEKALIKVRETGFKDAYIVSFFNGRNIPINRAKELEKENE